MFYLVETQKSFVQAVADLEIAVKNHHFGVLHIHDLGGTLRSKGVDFSENCKVFEICNPVQASKVLGIDMRLNMALPCRISVYTEEEITFIGMIEPAPLLGMLSKEDSLVDIAQAVQQQMVQMIDEAS